jgi:hypothetical protein
MLKVRKAKVRKWTKICDFRAIFGANFAYFGRFPLEFSFWREGREMKLINTHQAAFCMHQMSFALLHIRVSFDAGIFSILFFHHTDFSILDSRYSN